MARREIRRGEHGEDKLTEALMARYTVEGRHGLPETIDRPPIVALRLVGNAEVQVRQQVQDDLPTGRSEREGAPGVILVGHRGAKDSQEARACHVVDRPAIVVDLLLDRGIQGAHLAVECIQPLVCLERRGLGQGTPEQRDQFPLADGHAMDRGLGAALGARDASRRE